MTLPVFYPDEKCRFVIPASDVEKEPFLPDSSLKKLVCPSCHKNFEHKPANAYGDPRSIAYILHWDGFRPFSGKGNHGCGALEVQIATMCIACVASVSIWPGFGAKKDREPKSERGGRGRKETLADKSLDFENLRSPANAATDWLG